MATKPSVTRLNARYSNTRLTSRTTRFYDQSNTTVTNINIEESMTAEQKAYVARQKAVTSATTTVDVTPATGSISASLQFRSLSFLTPPQGFPDITKEDFSLFINGVAVESDAIDSITQTGVNVEVVLNSALNYNIEETDEYLIIGKFA